MRRRTFLTGLGGATLAAPFLPSLYRSAKAQDIVANPRRLVIFFTCNGCLMNRWFPTIEDGPVDASALAGQTLEVLTPYASKLLFPRGLAMYPSGFNRDDCPHDQAMSSKLTCAPIDSEALAMGRSLDHVLAEQVNQAGTGPLALSVTRSFGGRSLSFSAPMVAYPPESNPVNVYNNLTGLFVGGEGVADYRVAQGQSVLDLVEDDLDSYRRLNMSSADRQRIEDWSTLLRETEIQVVSAACNADTAAALGISTASVEEVSGGGGGFGGFGVDAATAMTAGADMMFKLIALTMMCDANRVILLQWPGFGYTFDWDGISHEYQHHGLSHRNGDDVGVGGTCVPNVIESLNEIDRWYANRYAELVGLIDGISEGEGTMLDNSAVMWLPELGDGARHQHDNLPIVIAGSAGGYLRQGVSVNLAGQEIGTGDSEASCASGEVTFDWNAGRNGNVPLNKLYVTLLNAMGATNDGAPFDSFGLWDNNDAEGITDPGELTQLKA